MNPSFKNYQEKRRRKVELIDLAQDNTLKILNEGYSVPDFDIARDEVYPLGYLFMSTVGARRGLEGVMQIIRNPDVWETEVINPEKYLKGRTLCERFARRWL